MSYQPLQSALKLGLLESEYYEIEKILGREPNFTELSIYSVMWSEHCSYKNSIIWLKTLPRKGEHLLAEAGQENAGLVDIGKGYACAFKIESHNHPSAIEPYQGAATGVGGINRDIFTMGARPIAQLNSLRFGDLKSEKTKWLLKGVVKGIGDYGNAFGVPVVGGEVYFDQSYQTNPLVNAMSAGVVKVDKTVSAISYGVGNPVFIVGSSTGKDGIHGATFASGDITENSAEDLPSVQVGDPFQEKLLLEATLELAQTDFIIGMQDMGAAGITCSTSEMSAKGGCGMDIYLDRVPTRQQNMEPFEILLSESQERMLVVGKKGFEKEIEKIFSKWDLNCIQIGNVIAGDTLNYYMNGHKVASVLASSLVLGGGAPVYKREYAQPDYIKECVDVELSEVPDIEDVDKAIGLVLQLPNIASKKWIYEQYDSMVQTNNLSTNHPTSSSIVYVKETDSYLALTVDCNSSYVYANPLVGAQIAVCEAARNIVASGGVPMAITNCLNFGNPYHPSAYWQFVMAVQGMGIACEKLNTPVTGGNVSFYNQSNIKGVEVPVNPTPTIGMLGLIHNPENITTIKCKSADNLIVCIGPKPKDINSSQYLIHLLGKRHSASPSFNLEVEYNVQRCAQTLIANNLVKSCNDIADGGMIVAILEMLFGTNLGVDVNLSETERKDIQLFGESQSRFLVEIEPNSLNALKEHCAHFAVEVNELAVLNDSGLLHINNKRISDLNHYQQLFNTAIEHQL